MRITITARHLEVTEILKKYAITKVENILGEYKRIIDVHIVLNVQKYRHIAEVMVCGRNLTLKTIQESNDLYLAIERALNKMKDRLNRHSKKLKDKKLESRKNPPKLISGSFEEEEV
jgi:putative sigma-54 modulation protein